MIRILLAALALLAAGCAVTSTEPDEAGVVYDAGPVGGNLNITAGH